MTPSRVASGRVVTITGENFGDGDNVPRVLFDAVEGLDVTWLSATTLTVVVPDLESGPVSVRIERNGESAISPQTLTVDNTPLQPTFSPAPWASGLATDVALRIRFTDPITYPGTQLAVQDGDEVQEMVSLRKASDDSEVDVTARYKAATNSIQVNPTNPLEDNQVYKLTLLEGTVAHELGTLLEQDTTIYFKTGPLTIEDDPISGFQESGKVKFQATVDGAPNFVSQAQVHYRGICDEGDWQTTDLERMLVETSFGHTLSEADDSIGIEYRYTFTDPLDSLRSSSVFYTYRIYPEGLKLKVKAGSQPEDYQLLSFPLTLDDKTVAGVMNELGPYDKERWRLFTVGANNQYQEHPAVSTLETGQGYLLLFRSSAITTINSGRGQAVEVTKDKPYKIPVHPGWNLIGNPYPFNVTWEAVVNHPDNVNAFASAEGELYAYGENWEIKQDTLSRGGGGLVNLSADADSLTIPIRTIAKSSRLATPEHRAYWKVGLSVRQQSGSLQRTLAGFGMHPEADTGWDAHDRATPPPLGRYLDINFHHPEHVQPYFAQDMVPVQPNHQWEFEVATSESASPLVLHWSSDALPRNEKQLFLWDLISNQITDMRKREAYTFPAGASRPFRILYGDDSFIEAHLQPIRVTLNPGYPNPFIHQTTLPFAIPVTQQPSRVVMTIYHISGQRVVVLQDGFMEAGLYQLPWDGTDASGRPVSAGVYIAELSVGHGSSGVKKRQRLVVAPH